MPSARFAPFLPILLAIAAGCGTHTDAERAGPFAERDSAFVDARGQRAVVHIVANRQPTWPAGSGWQLGGAPRLVIDGRAAGGAPFGRITGAARFDDGAIVVADARAHRIRLFDGGGRPIGWLGDGREAEDDGGFPGIGGVVLRGDTVIALDAPATVVRFTRDGTRLGATETELLDRFGNGFTGEYVRLLHDGSLLAWLYESEHVPRPAGSFRPAQGFLRLHPGRTREDTVGWYPGLEHVHDGLEARWTAFGADAHATADRRFIYVGDARQGAVHVHDYEGRLHRMIRLDRPAVPVTRRDVEAFRADFRARVLASGGPDAVASYERMLATIPAARAFPLFSALIADAAGNLWVETYAWPADQPPLWSVFDPRGRWLGDVTMPRGVTPVEIGERHLLGIRAGGPDGADRVELYELRKPPGSRSPPAAGGVAGG
jgi:hypothetical protein